MVDKSAKAFIHPFLFGIYPVLFLYSHNIYDTYLSQLSAPLIFILTITIFLIIALRFITKNNAKTGIILSFFYLLFFSYRSIFNLIRELDDGTNVDIIIFFVEIIFLGAGIFFIVRSKSSFRILTGFLNVFSITLISFSLFNIAIFAITHSNDNENSVVNNQIEIQDSLNPEMLPNIYHLVLDAYGREDVLKELYNYDNSDFTNYLESKGFYVAQKSAANYSQTYLSLGSMFNLNYLEEVLPWITSESRDKHWWKYPIRDFRFFKIIKKFGYNIFAFSSGYIHTELLNADVYNNQVYMTEFDNLLFNTTLLVPLVSRGYKFYDQYSFHRKRILGTFENLKDIPKFSSPTYIFAHIMSPHPPFVFDEHGNPRDAPWEFTTDDGSEYFQYPGTSREKYHEEYGNQLTYLNSELKEIINSILANPERPTIIIIQGDHGPRSFLDWENIEKSNFKETLSILNAYYFHDGNYEQLYENISPVNSFRVIFKQYFDLDYELLDDRSYMSTWNTPYDFIEYNQNDTNTSLF